METQLIRDLAIIISGIVVTLTAILMAVFIVSVYRKVNAIIKSTKTAAAKIEALAVTDSTPAAPGGIGPNESPKPGLRWLSHS